MSSGKGGPSTKPNLPSASLRVQTSLAGKPRPLVWGQTRMPGNLIYYADFHSRPAGGGGKSGGKGGGGGGKGGKGASGSYNYSATMIIGIAEGPVQAILQAWDGPTANTLAALNLSAFLGTYTQTSWSYVVSNHPADALGYRGLSYVAAAPFDLGGSPAIPNLTYEVQATISGTSVGGPDADPSIVIVDFLTNDHYGLGFPSEFIGSFKVYQSMCLAAGLVISDALVSQTAANTWLGDMLSATNSEFVWSGGLLTIVPYGDVGPIAANGYIYTPPSTMQFLLTDDDFQPNQGSASASNANDPVVVTRKRQSDRMNDIKVEYLDRNASYLSPDTGLPVSNAYNPTIVEAMDDASIAVFSLRSAPTKSFHFFCVESAAIMSAHLQLQRESIMATYSFTLDQRYIVLDPMDIVGLTDPALGLSGHPVIIKEITENSDATLSFVAEDYLPFTNPIPSHGVQSSLGFVHDYNVAPPPTNTPIIFAAPPQIAKNNGLEIWVVASGPTGWGGCDVWVSGDGATYLNVGRIVGPGRQGVTTAPVAVSADPDTTDAIPISMAVSSGEMLSGTTADADAANTLCYLGGELIGYSDASLTSQYHYTLGTYIRRGMYGTAIASHAAGTAFARLDSQVFHYPYSVDQIGRPLYVKLTAFNIFGGGSEGLDDVSPTIMTLPAPPAPSIVTGFGVKEFNGLVSFVWNPLQDFALKGYDIGYADHGTTDWSLFTMLTEASAGTEMTNGDVPPGVWTFGIRGRDIAGQLGPISFADLTVTNQDQIFSEVEQAPDWIGTLSGFIRHYTGVLVPLGTHAASYYTAWEDFTNFVVDPVSTASYTAPVADIGFDDTLRVHSTSGYTLGPSQTGTPTLTYSIDTWLTGGSDPASFTTWTIAETTLRYLVGRITYSGISAGNVAFLTEFAPIVDSARPPIQITQSATIAGGGSTVTYDRAFHLAPTVIATVVAATGLYASVSSITPTDCVINVWDHTGTSVGGSVNLQIQGE